MFFRHYKNILKNILFSHINFFLTQNQFKCFHIKNKVSINETFRFRQISTTKQLVKTNTKIFYFLLNFSLLINCDENIYLPHEGF